MSPDSITLDGQLLADKAEGIKLVYEALNLSKFGYFGFNLDALADRISDLIIEAQSEKKIVTLTITNSELIHNGVKSVLDDMVSYANESEECPGSFVVNFQ